MTEKNCFDMTKLICQIMCVTVVQWSSSCLNVQTPGDAVFCFFVPFFFSVWSLFFDTIFPFGLFFFILTADPAGHALGSIYILSLSPEFYFGKKINTSTFVHRLNHQYYYPIISTRSVAPEK